MNMKQMEEDYITNELNYKQVSQTLKAVSVRSKDGQVQTLYNSETMSE